MLHKAGEIYTTLYFVERRPTQATPFQSPCTSRVSCTSESYLSLYSSTVFIYNVKTAENHLIAVLMLEDIMKGPCPYVIINSNIS